MLFGQEFMPLEDLLFFGAASGGKLSEFTASGNPCVFETDVARPLSRLALSLLPRQSGSGDPSLSNIRPLLPWGEVGTWTGGTNTWDEQWEVGTISIETGENVVANDRIRTKNYNPCVPNKAYYIVDPTHGKNIRLFYYDKDKTFAGDSSWKDGEITTPSNAYFFRFIVASSYGTAYKNDIAINYPSSVTTYSPSSITPHPVNLQKNLFDPSKAVPGYYNAYGESFEPDATRQEVRTEYYVPVDEKEGITVGYNAYGQDEVVWLGVCWYNENKEFISRQAKSVGSYYYFPKLNNAHYARVSMRTYGHGNENCYVAYGNDLTFQPYLPPAYGCELDLTTGEGSIRPFEIESFKWGDGRSAQVIGNVERRGFIFAKKVKTTDELNADATARFCSVAPWKYNYSSDDVHFYGGEWSFYVFLPVGTSDDFEFQICAERDIAPTRFTLTPQQVTALVGVNTVWSDADNVELTYLKKG